MSRKRKLSILYFFFVLVAAWFFNKTLPKNTSPAPSPSPTNVVKISSSSAEFAKVTRIVDGDTIEIESGEKVRYIGVDTPELHHPKKSVQCFGREAMEKNKELVEGKTVRLKKDVSNTDRYGRLLRFVYLENDIASSEAIFVNDYLVREGFAHTATFPPDVKFSELFRASEREARENNRGLWKECK